MTRLPFVLFFLCVSLAGIWGQSADSMAIATDSLSQTVAEIPPVVVEKTTKDFQISDTGLSAQGFFRALLGMLFLVGICWLFSTNRRRINWRLVIVGILLQVIIALMLIPDYNFGGDMKDVVGAGGEPVRVEYNPFRYGLDKVASGFTKILGFTQEGVSFLFKSMDDGVMHPALRNFAFVILPTVIFFSALTSLLFFLGILQKIVFVLAWLMKKTMGLSGSESLAAAGNIFLGQTEAPLLIKPYISGMTRSEIMCLMTGGMATIAGGVLAAYISFLGNGDPVMEMYYAKHLLTASLLSAPAAIVAAKILVPEVNEVRTDMKISNEKIGTNFLEAISNGTIEGLKLAVNVGAMLLVFTAMIATFNFLLEGLIGDITGLNPEIAQVTKGRYSGLNLQFILGYVGSPIAWMLGVPSEDMLNVGQLLGQKTVLNEFYAYYELGEMKNSGKFMYEKSVVMATYILCGFSNFASIGIQIGGIGSLAPEKRAELSKLGFRAMLGGTVACLLTATVVGMFMS